VRENGGQYTHAATWVIRAFAELGNGDRAFELFKLINPISHSDTPEKIRQYRVEPYVIAADVYSREPYTGRGGWTWYTGSAGWLYRVGVESILGFKRTGDRLQLHPSIPRHWPGYEIHYRHGDTVYQIEVQNPNGANQRVRSITLDGDKLAGEDIPLQEDGKAHKVVVELG